MSKESGDGGKPSAKKPHLILKERCGGTRPEVKERNKRHRKLRKAIRTTLANGPKTIPELAAEIDVPTHDALWMLMAMKKYGEIREGEEREGYHEYAILVEEAQE